MIKYDLNTSKKLKRMVGKERWAAICFAIATMPMTELPAELVKILGKCFDIQISNLRKDLAIPLKRIWITKGDTRTDPWECLMSFEQPTESKAKKKEAK